MPARHVKERSGSQPSCPLVLEYVWRVMRKDHSDLQMVKMRPSMFWREDMTLEDDFLRHVVVRALGHGSRERSPFLHGCHTYSAVCAWHSKASASEHERNKIGYMVRIDVGKVDRHRIIDLSNRQVQGLFFPKGPDGYTKEVRDDFHFVRRAMLVREVLQPVAPSPARQEIAAFIGATQRLLHSAKAPSQIPQIGGVFFQIVCTALCAMTSLICVRLFSAALIKWISAPPSSSIMSSTSLPMGTNLAWFRPFSS